MISWKFNSKQIDRYLAYTTREEVERWQKEEFVPPPPGLTFRVWPPETRKEIDAAIECLKTAILDREQALSPDQIKLRDASERTVVYDTQDPEGGGTVVYDKPASREMDWDDGHGELPEPDEELPWWSET